MFVRFLLWRALLRRQRSWNSHSPRPKSTPKTSEEEEEKKRLSPASDIHVALNSLLAMARECQEAQRSPQDMQRILGDTHASTGLLKIGLQMVLRPSWARNLMCVRSSNANLSFSFSCCCCCASSPLVSGPRVGIASITMPSSNVLCAPCSKKKKKKKRTYKWHSGSCRGFFSSKDRVKARASEETTGLPECHLYSPSIIFKKQNTKHKTREKLR